MLTPYSRSQFVTKILSSATGEQYKVVFLVSLENGEMKAQIVSATPLVSKNETLYLAQTTVKTPAIFTYSPSFHPIVSPFNSLFFFNSQPTRAPAFAI